MKSRYIIPKLWQKIPDLSSTTLDTVYPKPLARPDSYVTRNGQEKGKVVYNPVVF